ncbi:MAG: cytochrome c [Nitrospirae bacterium]|nr:cytochrome c [Nitrospirota bacterium]
MKVIGRILLFVVAVTGFYAWFVTKIPQSESLPPEEIKLNPDTLTCAQVIEAGKKTLTGKGQCLVCHTIDPPDGRGPAYSGIGVRAAKRIPGKTASEYLYQSLAEPQAFVVEGFPPIMPPANKPPAMLNEFEMWAVVNYMESLGAQPGCDMEHLKTLLRAAAKEEKPVDLTPLTPEERGKQLFLTKAACGACHIVPGNPNAAAVLGPDLSKISAKGEEFIHKSILEPNAEIAVGYPPSVMPPDFATRLTPAEIDDIVAFLMTLR